MRLLRSSVALGSLLLLGAPSVAQTIDPDASVVHLRTSCTIDDCFDDTDDLTAWLWGGSGRNNPPSANDRVAIHVGPGDFDPFKCDGTSEDRGYVSVIGSGRQQSRFVKVGAGGGSVNLACRGGIHIENCQKLDFSHVAGVGYTGVLWEGGGSATWSDVDMIGEPTGSSCGAGALGWYDVPGEGGISVQHIFGSRAIARNHPWTMSALDSLSAEIWFWGGDLITQVAWASEPYTVATVIATENADVRLYGTSVRSYVGSGGSVTDLYGAWVTLGGELHMHGGSIEVSAEWGTGNIDAFGLRVEDSSSRAYTPGTAFVVKAKGTGVATRAAAISGGTVESPFVWPADTAPPAAGAPHGSDAFVETDRGTGSNEAHLMVRDTSCTGGGGNWRDMATGACR